MTVVELYAALKAAGIDDDVAQRAAQAVLGVEDRAQLATKADVADLRVALAELKTELLRAIADVRSDMMKMLMWSVGLNVGMMIAMTGVFAAIVNWLVR
jgi:hypothetical protein